MIQNIINLIKAKGFFGASCAIINKLNCIFHHRILKQDLIKRKIHDYNMFLPIDKVLMASDLARCFSSLSLVNIIASWSLA